MNLANAPVWILIVQGISLLQCAPLPQNAKPKDNAKDSKDLKNAAKYLVKFGYTSQDFADDDPTEEGMQGFLKNFQRYANIPVTGKLDIGTIKKMNESRCGMKDPRPKIKSNRTRRYNAQGNDWIYKLKEDRKLTWKVQNGGSRINKELTRGIMYDALDKWSKAANINFQESSTNDADILISYKVGIHGDSSKFDGRGGTLAHAFYPYPGASLSGDIHFDNDEDFTYRKNYGTDIMWVAVHEAGHSLGLDHSESPDAIMYPWYSGSTGKDFSLTNDDTRGIRSIYGAPQTTTSPPKPSPIPTDAATTTALSTAAPSTTASTTPATATPPIPTDAPKTAAPSTAAPTTREEPSVVTTQPVTTAASVQPPEPTDAPTTTTAATAAPTTKKEPSVVTTQPATTAASAQPPEPTDTTAAPSTAAPTTKEEPSVVTTQPATTAASLQPPEPTDTTTAAATAAPTTKEEPSVVTTQPATTAASLQPPEPTDATTAAATPPIPTDAPKTAAPSTAAPTTKEEPSVVTTQPATNAASAQPPEPTDTTAAPSTAAPTTKEEPSVVTTQPATTAASLQPPEPTDTTTAAATAAPTTKEEPSVVTTQPATTVASLQPPEPTDATTAAATPPIPTDAPKTAAPSTAAPTTKEEPSVVTTQPATNAASAQPPEPTDSTAAPSTAAPTTKEEASVISTVATTTTELKRTTEEEVITGITKTARPTGPIDSNCVLKIDAAVVAPTGWVYLFSGASFYLISRRGKEYGPLKTKSYFLGLEGKVTAAYRQQDDSLVLFTGNTYSVYYRFRRISGSKSVTDFGLPADTNVEAALVWNGNKYAKWKRGDKVYLFSGVLYYRHDIKKNKIDSGYPKVTAELWKGLPSKVNAAFSGYSIDGYNWQTHFIANDQYYIFNDRRVHTKPGFPKPIKTFLKCRYIS